LGGADYRLGSEVKDNFDLVFIDHATDQTGVLNISTHGHGLVLKSKPIII